MAYKDENGKITIDDVAAGEDIRKIERAQSILQNALQSLCLLYTSPSPRDS